MLYDSLAVVLSLLLLFGGAEVLVRGSASLALRAGLTPLVVGLTVVAFGTSAPELVVSIKANLAGQGDIAIGNVVGSNIFNIGVILGLTALICPVAVKLQIIRIDAPVMVAASLILPLLLLGGTLNRLEGLLLFVGIVAYTAWNVRLARTAPAPEVTEEFAEGTPGLSRHWSLDLIYILGGLAILVFGSRLLVDNSVSIARSLGISEAVIGLTIIAAGTSMPELATSAVAAFRRQPDIAVGNVVGSNIFNMLAIPGLTATIAPLTSSAIRLLDYGFMIGFAILLLPILRTSFKIHRIEGVLLLGLYALYLGLLWPK